MKSSILTAVLGSLVLGSSVAAQVEAGQKIEPGTQVKQAKQDRKKRAKKRRMQALEIGKTVPAKLALRSINGKTQSFGDLRGKVVFIHFWSIKCPWEKYAEPVILDLEAKYAGKKVAVIAINANQNEIGAAPSKKAGSRPSDAGQQDGEQKPVSPYANLLSHIKQTKGFKHEVFVDHGNKISKAFGARSTPHCFVVDAKGVLRYAGALDGYAMDRKNPTPFVKNAIDALLANKDVEVSSSKPYG